MNQLKLNSTERVLGGREGGRVSGSASRYWTLLGCVVAVGVISVCSPEYYLSIFNLILIAIVGAVGLNILVGNAGQVSIGHGAFMSVGSYAAANLITRLDAPFWIAIPAGGIAAAVVGIIVGIPSLRIRGIYLVVSTLAAQVIIEWLINHVHAISGGTQASIDVPRPRIGSLELKSQQQFFVFLSVFAFIAVIAAFNIGRTRVGRAFIAIRDQDIAAEIMGINISRYKLIAFTISSFYAGVAGVLYTYFLGIANYEQFQLSVSIDYLAMIIIGGLASVRGAIFGAAFVTLLPIICRWVLEAIGGSFPGAAALVPLIPHLRLAIFGALIIVFLVAEPDGLNKLWANAMGGLKAVWIARKQRSS